MMPPTVFAILSKKFFFKLHLFRLISCVGFIPNRSYPKLLIYASIKFISFLNIIDRAKPALDVSRVKFRRGVHFPFFRFWFQVSNLKGVLLKKLKFKMWRGRTGRAPDGQPTPPRHTRFAHSFLFSPRKQRTQDDPSDSRTK